MLQRPSRRLGVAVRVAVLGHDAQRVGRARQGERVARAVGGLQRRVVRRVALLRRDGHELRSRQGLGGREAGVGESGDVGAARADGADGRPVEPHQGPAADPDRAHVQRGQVGLAAAEPGVPHLHPAAAHDADVGRRATGLQEHALAEPFPHQRPGHPGRRTAQSREQRPFPHLRQRHHAAVAAHHHQRRGDARRRDAALDQVGGLHHPRHDPGVQHRRAGPFRQPVQAGDLMGRGGEQPLRPGLGHNLLLPHRVVDAERLHRHDDLRALVDDLRHRGLHRDRVVGVAQPRVPDGQPLAGRQPELRQPPEPPGRPRLEAAPDPDHAHGRDVALQQRVRRLGRAVRQERHHRSVDPGPLLELAQRGQDAVRDPVGVVVAGGDLHLAEQGERRRVHGHGVGERATDVDADPDGVWHHREHLRVLGDLSSRARRASGVRRPPGPGPGRTRRAAWRRRGSAAGTCRGAGRSPRGGPRPRRRSTPRGAGGSSRW